MNDHLVKLVVLGNAGVGKTSLLSRFKFKRLPQKNASKLFQKEVKCTVFVEREGRSFECELWEVPCHDEEQRTRPNYYYPDTDVFVVCLSVTCRQSFNDVQFKWMPEIKKYYPHVPVILVGTKTDLRQKNGPKDKSCTDSCQLFTTIFEGAELTHVVRATKYLECSALNKEGVDAVFEEALSYGIKAYEKRMRKLKSCVVS